MALEYKLVPDPENPGKYKAEIVNQKEFDLDDVIDKMMESDRLKHLPRGEVRKMTESYMAAILLKAVDGDSIETPLFNVSNGKITPGAKLARVAENIELKEWMSRAF